MNFVILKDLNYIKTPIRRNRGGTSALSRALISVVESAAAGSLDDESVAEDLLSFSLGFRDVLLLAPRERASNRASERMGLHSFCPPLRRSLASIIVMPPKS